MVESFKKKTLNLMSKTAKYVYLSRRQYCTIVFEMKIEITVY